MSEIFPSGVEICRKGKIRRAYRSRLAIDDKIPRCLLAWCAGLYDKYSKLASVHVIIVPWPRARSSTFLIVYHIPLPHSRRMPPRLSPCRCVCFRLRLRVNYADYLSPSLLRCARAPPSMLDSMLRSANCTGPLQIVPTASNGIDAVNFRQMNESTSLHLEKQSSLTPIKGVAGSSVPGSPGLGGDDGVDPSPAPPTVDEFSAFSSITLQYDGEL